MPVFRYRYDLITPVKSAYELHKALPKSKLVVVHNTGHSGMLMYSVTKLKYLRIAFFLFFFVFNYLCIIIGLIISYNNCYNL